MSRAGAGWVAVVMIALLAGCGREAEPATAPALSQLLGRAPDSGFVPATAPAALHFPFDHGPHPRTRVEWWYVTANLRDADGRRYGAQLALFRFALRPEGQALAADWSSGQLYMSHLALSELDVGRFRFDQRLERAALGLAGAERAPLRVWLPNCQMLSDSDQALFPLRLDCRGEHDGEAFAIDLRLEAGKPRALHGRDGYSRKSDVPGSASYYYSYPRLAAAGELAIGDRRIAASGAAWMDHEWGSSVLAGDQTGWDWFSVQLDDGHELMFFHIRGADGRPVSARGSLIDPEGKVRPFAEGVLIAEPVRWWTSPLSGARYPIAWRLASEALALDLTIAARQPDQELRTQVRYWEGSIEVAGRHVGEPVSGEGFLELTGY